MYALEHYPISLAKINHPNLMVIPSISDGSCLFHSLAQAYFSPYQTGMLNGQSVDRRQLIKTMRADLSVKLGSPVDAIDPTSPIYYDTLSRGKLRELSKDLPQYSLENMQKELREGGPVDNIYYEFVCSIYNCDLYIVDRGTGDIIITGVSDSDLYHQGRPSIVLLYSPGHYDLLGVNGVSPAGRPSITTLFEPGHALIQILQQRITERIKVTK